LATKNRQAGPNVGANVTLIPDSARAPASTGGNSRYARLAFAIELVYLTYSNQLALGFGDITGGLTNFSFGDGFKLLDHDQRNTLHIGGEVHAGLAELCID
jgi:hypothetical protein